MMKTAPALVTLFVLVAVPGSAFASSLYAGVMGGWSQIRDTRFNTGDEGETRVTSEYRSGDTLSLVLGSVAEGSERFRGRRELELGFQRGNVDSLTFDDTTDDDDQLAEEDLEFDDDGEPVETGGEKTTKANVSGAAEAAFGFFNLYGDFRLRENVDLVAGFGVGVGEVTFDTQSAEGRGVVMDDSDITWGFQVNLGLAYRLLERIDIEASYRHRSWEDVRLRSEEGIRTQVRVPSHNVQAGLRFRF